MNQNKTKILRVLLLKDGHNLAQSVIEHLEIKRRECNYRTDRKQGIIVLKSNKFYMLIFDISTLHMHGYQLCSWLNNSGYIVPVMVLSGSTALPDKLEEFSCGADNYLTKAFTIKELIARIQSLVKHQIKPETKVLNSPPTSWIILEKLMLNYPKPVNYDELSIAIFAGPLPNKKTETIQVYMYKLIQALDKHFTHALICVVKDYGFKLHRHS